MTSSDITRIFKNPLNNVSEAIGDELKQVFFNRIIEYQVEEYKRNLSAKTILHKAAPKNLYEFYEPLFITTGQDYESTIERVSTNSTEKLFSRHSYGYITLIGSAGSGKSTIVRHLFIKCFEEKYKIPIKIELRYLNEYDKRFHDYVYNEIFQFHNLGFTDRIINRMLSSSEFVFFLDGYDELSNRIKEQTTKDIDSFVTKYPKNKYLVTSRPYTNIEGLPLFNNYEVSPLTKSEIESFINKQIPTQQEEISKKIIKAISNDENKSYHEYLSNPLLLSMFILTFQSYSDIPQKRSYFYEQVFNTLFSNHDSISKLAFVREKSSGLSKDQFEEVLQAFSFLSFFNDRFTFSERTLFKTWNQIKKKKTSLEFDNSKLLDDLQVAIGILNKDGVEFTFPHRSLQEYFAASYVANLPFENKKILYDKIVKTMIDSVSKRKGISLELINREHFITLLYELDEYNIIEFAIIPLLKSIEEDYNFKSKSYRNELAIFVKTEALYYSFSKILPPSLFSKIKGVIQPKFSNQNRKPLDHHLGNQTEDKSDDQPKMEAEGAFSRIKRILIAQSAGQMSLYDMYFKKTIQPNLDPLLKEFIPQLRKTRKNLENYLISQKRSETEIINLI